MRGLALALVAVLLSAGAAAAQPEPTRNDLLRAVEKQLVAANEVAGPAVVCVVVSRSDRYPPAPGAADNPGKLGDFNPAQFAKDNPK
ncbi:MAG: hypothetical protein K2V38_22365, partial [Gemmataceae bacterium]|nr:hypothetical protein [Gemmataceae bacterium]